MFAEAAQGHELVEWLPHEAPAPAIDGFGAAIVFGAEAQVDQEEAFPWLRPEKRVVGELLARGTPVLGVCFGSQLLAELAGAEVRRAAEPEIGWYEVELTPEGSADPLLGFLPERFESLQWHHYEWLLPAGAVALARSARLPAGVPAGGPAGLGRAVPPRGDRGRLRLVARRVQRRPWRGERPASIPRPSAPRRPARSRAWNDVGRGIAERFLATAA